MNRKRAISYQATGAVFPEREVPQEAHEQYFHMPLLLAGNLLCPSVTDDVRLEQAVHVPQDEPIRAGAEDAREDELGGLGRECEVGFKEGWDLGGHFVCIRWWMVGFVKALSQKSR